MRLGIFTHYYEPEIGAPSARLGDFARAWAEAGHEVHVITCFPNHPTGVVHPGYQSARYGQEKRGPVTVHRNWTYVTPNSGILKRTLGHASLWLSARRNAARLPRFDAVIGSSPTLFAAMAARDCARRQGAPFIMEVRDLWPAIFRDLGVLKNRHALALLEKWEMAMYRRAQRIVTVTRAFEADIVRRGIPADKMVTITNGADVDFWRGEHAAPERLRAEVGLGEKFVALYIGAHGISQGLDTLLRAAEAARSAEQIAWVFVGEGADKARLETIARERRLTNVHFFPAQAKERVRDFYALADVCLVPLRAVPLFDAFIPSKLFEILAMGRPIVGSVRGEAAEILQRSGAAEVVAPEDAEAIVAGVQRLATDTARRAKLAAAARPFVEAHYSRRGLAARYLAVLQQASAPAQKDPA